MIVSQVVDRGRDSYQRTDKKGSYCVAAKKADVTACRIMKDGQILTRSPIYIGDEWEYVQ